MAIKTKLMANYGCDPLWWINADNVITSYARYTGVSNIKSAS